MNRLSLDDAELDELRAAIQQDRVSLISDIVNISQTPAPTFDESERAELMEKRFREMGVDNVYRDPEGNVVAHVREQEEPVVCVCAHLDTVFGRSVDHNVHVDDRVIQGPSVGDDSLGLASLLSVLRLIEPDRTGHLILIATTGTEGDGNLRGSRYFVENSRYDIDLALCLEGHGLGRIDHWSLGTRRLRIRAESEGGHVWRDQTGENPIEAVGELITRLRSIGKKYREGNPMGIVNVGLIRGGSAYNTVPYECDMNVEIRSPDASTLDRLFDRVFEAVESVNQDTRVDISVQEVSRRPASGIDDDHWLVRTMESIHERLSLPSQKGPASSDGCVFLDAGIPTLTLGLARGRDKHRENEQIDVESLGDGQLQLVLGILEGVHQLPQQETATASPS